MYRHNNLKVGPVFYFVWSLILLPVPLSSWAALKIDISIIYKKGPEQKMVLSSELHASETMYLGEDLKLEMNNGMIFIFNAHFASQSPDGKEPIYGPSDLLEVNLTIVNDNGFINSFANPGVLVPLNTQKQIDYRDPNDQLVQITLGPSWQL